MLSKYLYILITLAASVLATPGLRPRVVAGAGWTVKGLTRACDTLSTSPSCRYQYTISQLPTQGNSPPDFDCTITDFGPASPPPANSSAPFDPLHNSFYASPCNAHAGVDGGWQLSWGYNPAYDSAVITLINYKLGQDAFFGWNGVNARGNPAGFEQQGPNSVYTIGTFT